MELLGSVLFLVLVGSSGTSGELKSENELKRLSLNVVCFIITEQTDQNRTLNGSTRSSNRSFSE